MDFAMCRPNLRFCAFALAAVGLQVSAALGARHFLDQIAVPGQPLNIVVLADSSTSMDDRQRAGQQLFLQALAEELDDDDRLLLAALDVGADWLIGGFVRAGERERLAEALARLSRRWSLGWTDIPLALRQAIDQVAADATFRAASAARERRESGGLAARTPTADATEWTEEEDAPDEGVGNAATGGWGGRLRKWFAGGESARRPKGDDESDGEEPPVPSANGTTVAATSVYHILYVGDGIAATAETDPQIFARLIEGLFAATGERLSLVGPIRIVGHAVATGGVCEKGILEALAGSTGIRRQIDETGVVMPADDNPNEPSAKQIDQRSTPADQRPPDERPAETPLVHSPLLAGSGGRLISLYDAIVAIRDQPEEIFAASQRWAKTLAGGDLSAGVGPVSARLPVESSVMAGDEGFLAQTLLETAEDGLIVSERVALLEILRPVYQRAPDHLRLERDWTQRMAALLRAQGKDERALATVETLARKMPWDARIYCDYGEALALAGKIDEANEWLERGAATPERFWQIGGREVVRQAHVELLERFVPAERALPAIAERLSEMPASEADYRRLVRTMVRAGRTDEALAMVGQWLALAEASAAPDAADVAKITAAARVVAGPDAILSPRGVEDDWLELLAGVIVAATRHADLLPAADTVARRTGIRQSPPIQAALATVAARLANDARALGPYHGETLTAWLETAKPTAESLPAAAREPQPAPAAVATPPVSPPDENHLRDMRLILRQAESGTRLRLAHAGRYADALWRHGQGDVAAEVLVREVSDYQQANGGIASPRETATLVQLVNMLSATGRFNWAERILNGNVARAETKAHAETVRLLLYRLYGRALVAGGETDLGRDEELYRQTLKRIHRQFGEMLARPGQVDGDAVSALLSAAADFFQAADQAQMPSLARDVRTLAIDVLPNLLVKLENSTRYDLVARKVANSLVRPHLGARDAISFAIAAIKTRPAHLPAGERHALLDDVAMWRRSVDHLGPVETPLLALAGEVLADALLFENGEIPALCGGASATAVQTQNLFWREKADDFARVAEQCHRARREWRGANTRAADYLYRHLGRHDRAVDMLLELAAENLLATNGQIGLATKLVAHERFDEALATVEKLPPEALVDQRVETLALAAFAARDDMRRMVDAVQAQYENIVRENPRDVASLHSLISLLDRVGAGDQALPYSYQLTRAAPLDAAAHADFSRRVLVLEDVGNYERALTAIVDAMPHRTEAHAMVARRREQQRRWAEAAAHWRQVASLDETSPEGLLRMARAQSKAGDVDGGLTTVVTILNRKWAPEHGDVYVRALELLSKN